MKDVAGKIVLVTGAAMGMGKMFAANAVRENAAAVVLWDINEATLKETATDLEALGGTVHSYVVDVADRTAIEESAAAVRAEVGDPDIVFNNAGVVRGNAYFWETDNARDTEFTMSINALAPMYVAREFLPGMIAKASGAQCRLVNMASAAGLTANPRMASYAGSKWAAVGWSESVRLELEQAGHHNVQVTTVCPYYIKTGMFAGASPGLFLPLLEPEDVVSKVWSSMKKGRPMVVMPKTVLLNESIKGVLPVHVRDFLGGRVFGAHKTMEHFTGRPDPSGETPKG